MKIKLLFLSLLLISCGRFEKKRPKQNTQDARITQLSQKQELYLQLIQFHLDEYGFILHEECDSLLFTGLLSAVQPISTDITSAKNENNQWFRRPITKPCNSLSTISRDMFIGLMWYIWRHKQLDLANQIFDYGRDNKWVMGQGDISRTFFTPNMQATLAQLIYKLGGTDHVFERNLPMTWGSVSGFEAHIQILLILLVGEMNKKINGDMLDRIKAYKRDNPKNALFSYAYHLYIDGNQSETLNILLDESLYPANSLPTTDNFCTEWLWQRDQFKDGQVNTDWLPCNGNKEHTGADFLFVSGLLLQKD